MSELRSSNPEKLRSTSCAVQQVREEVCSIATMHSVARSARVECFDRGSRPKISRLVGVHRGDMPSVLCHAHACGSSQNGFRLLQGGCKRRTLARAGCIFQKCVTHVASSSSSSPSHRRSCHVQSNITFGQARTRTHLNATTTRTLGVGPKDTLAV